MKKLSINETNKKKRLMIITHDLALGGLQQVIVNICQTINREIFSPSIICLRALGDYLPEIENLGIKVQLIPQKKGTDYFSFLKVAKILRKEKIDIIHTHNTQPFMDGVIGGILAGVKTIVHTDHARDFPDKKRYMFAEWFLSHFVYKVVAVSEHTALNLQTYEKISPKKIRIIYNGINGTIRDLHIDKIKKKIELGIAKSGPIIGLGVRLSEQKGIAYLLNAMPEIIRSFPEITLLIAGRGPLEEKLKGQTVSMGLQSHVLFIGMRLDIPEILKLLDCYVLPSLWEGLPMVLLEAMAAGCPIVTTDVGGVCSAIQSGVTGLLVKPGNSGELAQAVISMLSNPELRAACIQNGLRVFNEKFDSSVMTRSYEKLYLRENG
jgi:glycosyltransferase involved in cell wall biosynthesis